MQHTVQYHTAARITQFAAIDGHHDCTVFFLDHTAAYMVVLVVPFPYLQHDVHHVCMIHQSFVMHMYIMLQLVAPFIGQALSSPQVQSEHSSEPFWPVIIRNCSAAWDFRISRTIDRRIVMAKWPGQSGQRACQHCHADPKRYKLRR